MVVGWTSALLRESISSPVRLQDLTAVYKEPRWPVLMSRELPALPLSQFGGEGFTNENLKEVLLEGANASLINYNGKAMGPHLGCVLGSMGSGLSKYGRENNNPPVIETSYTGDFKFRQWESVSIPFTVSDPDGDNVEVTTDFEGRAKLVRGSKDPDIYNFEILCELVSDFTPKKAKITATDVYGGTAEV